MKEMMDNYTYYTLIEKRESANCDSLTKTWYPDDLSRVKDL